MVIDPNKDFFEVPAFMQRVEVGVRITEAMDPFESDYTCVGNTHQVLPQYLNAVISRLVRTNP
jgi:hypothetical protein